jgi:hypothetical protein
MCVADDCCAKCFRSLARALLIILNLLFFLAGLLMLGLGIALVAAPTKVLTFFKFDFATSTTLSAVTGGAITAVIKDVGIFMIILGAIVVIIGFFGFFGASCDNKCMLVTYAVFLIIIVLAEIALIIFAARYPGTFTSAAELVVNLSFDDFNHDLVVTSSGTINYNDPSITDTDGGWAVAQIALKCCGVYGYEDYQNLTSGWTRCGNPTYCPLTDVIPISCCTLNDPSRLPYGVNNFTNLAGCQSSPPAPQSFNSGGCVQQIVSDSTAFVKQNSKIAIGIAAGIVGVEIILIVLAFVVCCMETEGGKYV